MDSDVLRVVIITVLVTGSSLWLVAGFLFRVSGIWVREIDDDERAQGRRPERLELSSLGPLVSGRAEVDGGRHEFSGYLVGPRLFLVRRDHGHDALLDAGYPPKIAQQRDGEVAAKLRLRLDGPRLVGEFIGQRVEFTHQPPRVTRVSDLPAERRSYTRLAEVDDALLVPDAAADPTTAEPA